MNEHEREDYVRLVSYLGEWTHVWLSDETWRALLSGSFARDERSAHADKSGPIFDKFFDKSTFDKIAGD